MKSLLIKTDIIDKNLFKIINDFVDFFKAIRVNYWLGGGLFECIIREKYKYLKKWDWSSHDIDFHVLAKDRKKIEKNIEILTRKGYKCFKRLNRKIVFKTLNDQKIEFPYLKASRHDRRLVFFLGHGKKCAPHMQEQNIRKRLYHYDIPKEFFDRDSIKVGNLKVCIPKDDYANFIYHFPLINKNRKRF